MVFALLQLSPYSLTGLAIHSIIAVKQSPVMQQELAEEVLCTENISYGGVISARAPLHSEVDGTPEDDDYVQI